MRAFIERFMANLSDPPEPGPELIPTRWRIPFFVTLVVVSLVLLALVVRFVVVPGISSQQAGSGAVQSGSQK